MAMSTKHYVAIAELLHSEMVMACFAGDSSQATTIRNITLSLADIMAQDNPRFNRALFYKVVGIVATVIA